jgi:exopolysaccharide production protein ExoZ
MSFEMFFYLILGTILLKTVQRAVPALMLLLLTLVVIGSMVGIRHPVAILIANPILLEFVFGATIALIHVRAGNRRIPGIAITSLGVITSCYLSIQYLPGVAIGPQMILIDRGVFARVATWGVSAALLVSGIVFWSPSMKGVFGRFWIILGNASYSAYVISALVLEYAARLFFKLDRPPALSFANRLLFEMLMLTAVMSAGLACYTFLEKPMLRFLQSRFLRRSSPRAFVPSPYMAPDSPAV